MNALLAQISVLEAIYKLAETTMQILAQNGEIHKLAQMAARIISAKQLEKTTARLQNGILFSKEHTGS